MQKEHQRSTITGTLLEHDDTSSKDFVFLERHRPQNFHQPYHFHTSIEINFLSGCDMTYSFSGDEIVVEDGVFTVFWAAYPHRPTSVTNTNGVITNAYVALSEFLQWPLPSTFVNAVLGGAVVAAKSTKDGDEALAQRWADEKHLNAPEWQSLHSAEIQARLHRLAIEGWHELCRPKSAPTSGMVAGSAIENFQRMLTFIAANFTEKISITDVANSAGVTRNYAISLFRKVLGRTIKEHITDMRMVHAKMLLAETDRKILTIALDCGFGSLSPFYEAFGKYNSVSPIAFRNGEGRLPHSSTPPTKPTAKI